MARILVLNGSDKPEMFTFLCKLFFGWLNGSHSILIYDSIEDILVEER